MNKAGSFWILLMIFSIQIGADLNLSGPKFIFAKFWDFFLNHLAGNFKIYTVYTCVEVEKFGKYFFNSTNRQVIKHDVL